MSPKAALRKISEGLLFASLYGPIAADELRTVFANTVRNPLANVVGYQNTELRAGSKMVAPMFINVGQTGSIKISDIWVTGYPPYVGMSGGTPGEVILKVLNSAGGTDVEEDGVTLKEYYFIDNIMTDPMMQQTQYGPGWYREGLVSDANYVSEITFDQGDGLWIQGVDDYKVQISGQVASNPVTVPLRAGSVGTGNPYAVGRTIDNFWVTGYPPYAGMSGGTPGEVILKVLNSAGGTDVEEDGVTLREYYFIDNIMTDPMMQQTQYGPGWYREGLVSDANYVSGDNLPPFAPGEGLWVQGVDDYNLTIQAPVIK